MNNTQKQSINGEEQLVSLSERGVTHVDNALWLQSCGQITLDNTDVSDTLTQSGDFDMVTPLSPVHFALACRDYYKHSK